MQLFCWFTISTRCWLRVWASNNAMLRCLSNEVTLVAKSQCKRKALWCVRGSAYQAIIFHLTPIAQPESPSQNDLWSSPNHIFILRILFSLRRPMPRPLQIQRPLTTDAHSSISSPSQCTVYTPSPFQWSHVSWRTAGLGDRGGYHRGHCCRLLLDIGRRVFHARVMCHCSINS